MRYLLPESTVMIDGRVDLIHDTRLDHDPRVYLGQPTATVALSVRADSSHGVRFLRAPQRGDNSMTVDYTADQRLAGVAWNSVGIGSKVVGAGVRTLAVVLGTAFRLATLGSLGSLAWSAQSTVDLRDPTRVDVTPPDEDDVRRRWDDSNELLVEHQREHRRIADAATAQLTAVRSTMPTMDDPLQMARAARRIQHLQALLTEAMAEVAKIDGLYAAWCAARTRRDPQHLTFAVPIDELPIQEAPTARQPAWDPTAEGDDHPLLRHIWATLGLLVEIGPVEPRTPYRPNPDGSVGDLDQASLHWREPRPARLWIWRRDSEGTPVLEQLSEVLVTDRYSAAASMRLEGRFFGEQAAEVVFGDLGVPLKVVFGDKSAVGAVADAIASAPEQSTAGLDAVSTASTTLGDLSSAAQELRLKALKRQVEQRTQELELEGLNATAADFAELRHLQQRVEMAEAQGTLAPPGELASIESQLALEKAHQDLETVQRERAQAADMAAVQSRIERLEADLALAELRREREGG